MFLFVARCEKSVYFKSSLKIVMFNQEYIMYFGQEDKISHGIPHFAILMNPNNWHLDLVLFISPEGLYVSYFDILQVLFTPV